MNYFPKDIQNIIYEYNNRKETVDRIRNLIPNTTPEPFPNLKFKETRELILASDTPYPGIVMVKTMCHTLIHQYEVLKSIRTNLEQNIVSIGLEIGGEYIDKIEQSSFATLRKLYQMDDNEIPFHLLKIGIPYLRYHEIKFYMEFKWDPNQRQFLYGDFYHYNQDYQGEIKYFQLFNSSSYQMSSGTILNLYWNYPIYYVMTDHQDSKEIILNLDNAVKIYLIKIYQIGQYDAYALSKSKSYKDIIFDGIDFSFRKGDILLEGNQLAHICPIISRELVICEGMAGFRRAN